MDTLFKDMTMAKNKEETIFVQNGAERIELIGKSKEAFIAQRETDNEESDLRQAEKETQKALKVSAYTKLGLTTEEIGAIL